MSLEILGLQLLNAVSFSVLLFLVAAGLSLILGLMDVVNLAHGAAYLLGGYVGLSIVRETDSFWLALAGAPLIVAVFGLAVERLLLRRLYGRGHLAQVLLTFGVALIAADTMLWQWGGDVQSIPAPEPFNRSVLILGNAFPLYRLGVIGIGISVAGGLWLLIERTRIGAVVRAGVSDRQMAAGLGINIDRAFSLVFALGTALAALGGVLAGPILTLHPGADFDILILALVVVVLGGLGSIRGAVFGAAIVGIVSTLTNAFVPQVSLFAVFLLMALVLVMRPTGLLSAAR